jgi:hypothetical protein
MSENGVLRGLSGPSSEEITGGWRKFHYEELYNLYYALSIIRVNK